MEKLKKIRSESLRSQVYKQLKENLLAGVWKVGEKLPSESELCNTLGVSRVTVRAAIQQLEILGLVETRQGNGTTVTDFSGVSSINAFHPVIQINDNQDILHILEYRKMVETGTIVLAVDRISDQDFAFLEEKLQVMKESVDNFEKHAKADHLFHFRIAQCTQNPIIIKVYSLINEMLSTAMVDVVELIGCEIGLKYHRQLIDALHKKDKELCRKTMELHLQETITALIEKRENANT